MGELVRRLTASVDAFIFVAEFLKLVLKIFIGTIRLYLIEHARARVFHLYSRHLDARPLNIVEIDRLEELVLLDFVNT